MSDNNDVGKINRCSCGSTAKHIIVLETRKAVGWYKCTACTVELLFAIMDREGDCTCGHSVVLHTDKCTAPHCKCGIDRIRLSRES